MSPLVGYHATNPKCRDSIRRRGLLASGPYLFNNTGRYNRKGRSHLQPFGVYVYRTDGAVSHSTYGKTGSIVCSWCGGPGMDIWEVAYIGQLCADPFVENALCLFDSVPPQNITLMTHITGNIT